MSTGPRPSTVAFADDERTATFVARSWAALAALGAGLVLLALGAEHVTAHPLVGAALLGVGAAELLWSLAAMRGPLPLPRTTLGVLLVGAVGWVLAAPAVGTLGAAELTAVGLQLLAAVLVAVASRTTTSAPDPVARSHPLGRLGLLAAGALAIAALTVPGLAATDAGAHAQPHGSHGLPGFPGLGGHAGHGG